ncbi:MAG TPA: hypothetical protein VEK57_12210 [Thermoanaerobaculia bacterium]|nr:hypothetical protein [Thermoanaerobaculia bacterium]
MKKRSVLLATVVGALLLGSVAQADVKVVTGSPRAAKAIAAEAARTAAAPAPTVLARESWTGTRAIIFDQATKTVRKPNATEVAQMVSHLRQMTNRPERTKKSVQANRTSGTRQGSIEGDQANVIVARANADGSYETLCVHTFEEAAEFLGLKRSAPGTSSGQ